MEKATYLTKYCNMCFEWQLNGITTDNATESQLNELWELQNKAIKQSGLTENELVLICMCRKYGIFRKVNQYAHSLKNSQRTLP